MLLDDVSQGGGEHGQPLGQLESHPLAAQAPDAPHRLVHLEVVVGGKDQEVVVEPIVWRRVYFWTVFWCFWS